MSSSCGFLRLYKKAGDSSFKALFPVKRAFRGCKVGHAGTLDPDATGLLIVAIGAATRLLSYAEDWDKTYSFRLHLGFATDTYDTTGTTTAQASVPELSAELILAQLPQFTGLIEQIPPKYSALKIDGQRAYDLARKGVEVEMKSRPVTIHKLELIDLGSDEQGPWIDLRARCSKGTYIRSLGVDLAKALGTLGCVSHIHREAIGEHGLDGAIDSFDPEAQFQLEPVHNFIDLPQIQAPESALPKMYNGNAQGWEGVSELPAGQAYFVLNTAGEPFCLAHSSKGLLQPKIRLVE